MTPNNALEIEVYQPSAIRGGIAIKLEGKPGSGLMSSGGSYSPQQIELLIDDLRAALVEADDLAQGPFVQVKFLSGAGSKLTQFTYRDPSGTLQVGDLVEVPSRYGTGIAKVSKLGKGAFKGNILEVTAKLSKEVLAA